MSAAVAAPATSPEPPTGSIDFRALATNRAAQDRLLERVRLSLDGEEFTLPVLKSGPNRRWLERLDVETRGYLSTIQGDPGDGTAIAAQFMSAAIMPAIKAALYEYDVTGVLPPQEALDERITDMAYLRALLEVWAAANPLVGTVIGTLTAILTVSSLPRTNTPPANTAGRRRGSRKN